MLYSDQIRNEFNGKFLKQRSEEFRFEFKLK
jgi:hypothetical protein